MTEKAVRRRGRGAEKEGQSQQLKFHGARPLGMGASGVSGPPQWGQLSSAGGLVVLTAARISLLVVRASSCLAF